VADAPLQPQPPPRSARPASSDRRAIVLAGSVVLALIVVAAAVTLVPGFRDRDNNNLGADVYEIQASTVRANSPVLLNDLVGGDRPIWVTHVGDDQTTGYFAFAAVAPDGCAVEVDRDTLELRRACDGAPVGLDGDGLPQYDVGYDDGLLRIDLNFAERSEDAP
jgi:hypothetical protein